MRLRFIVPADVDSATGGNVYDLAVAAALDAGGDDVELVRCESSELADALQANWPGPTLVDGLLACRQPTALDGTALGVLVHMPLALETGLSPDRARALDDRERQALRAAAVVVATSHWCADYLSQRHQLSTVAVATPGVEPADVGIGSDPPLIVHVAAVLPHKDQLGIVSALEMVRDLPWRARLAGSRERNPAYAAAVRSAIEDAGLADRIDLPGVMTRDAAFYGADLSLLPSRVESFGLVVTESLARGIPAFVSEGGPAEALGLTPTGAMPGAVVPAGDPAALADALRTWLSDEAYRTQLRAHALDRRATLEGWDATATNLRLALASL